MSEEDLEKEIAGLRAGGEDGWRPELVPTAGQWWMKLLGLPVEERIRMLAFILERGEDGSKCLLEGHLGELGYRHQALTEMSRSALEWRTSRRLISGYIVRLREDGVNLVPQGRVASSLEDFLNAGPPEPDNRCRRILCGHRWTEAGRIFECAEPVGSDGTHQGEHFAYVREGDAADEELRMKSLEQENAELRRRLGLPANGRRPSPHSTWRGPRADLHIRDEAVLIPEICPVCRHEPHTPGHCRSKALSLGCGCLCE